MGKMRYTLLKSTVCAALAVLIVLGTHSCKPLPNNGVPIYLHVDSPKVNSVYPYGTDSNYIPDVWATSGSANLGAFEMPVDIPILASGNVPIAISAGIWDNGIVSVPTEYPFYAPDTFTIYNAQPGHIYHRHPVYMYITGTQVALNVDFESGNPFDSVTTWSNPQNGNVFQGAASGAIIIPQADSSFRVNQRIPMQINTNGRQAYIEINYKITNPNSLMEVGITNSTYSPSNGGFINQTDYSYVYLAGNGAQWRKAYLNFNTAVGTNSISPNNYFQVYITVYHDAIQQDTVFFDNLKFLYFH
jgi:hypothetical protein